VVLSVCMGTTIYPYLFFRNGPLLTSLVIGFAAFFSALSGFWITRVAAATQARRYEDMALKTYGNKCATFTAIMMLLSMMGFTTANIVLVSNNYAELLVKKFITSGFRNGFSELIAFMDCQYSSGTKVLGIHFFLCNLNSNVTSKTVKRTKVINIYRFPIIFVHNYRYHC
jgi:amino acid permease